APRSRSPSRGRRCSGARSRWSSSVRTTGPEGASVREGSGSGMDIDMNVLRMIEHEREISLDVLVGAIEQALHSAYQRTPGAYPDARVELDRRSGRVTVYARERIPQAVEPVDAPEPSAAAAAGPEGGGAGDTAFDPGVDPSERAEPGYDLGPEFDH